MGTRHVLFIIFFAAALIVALILFSVKINPAASVSLPTDTVQAQEGQEQPTTPPTHAVEAALDEVAQEPSPEIPLPDAQVVLQSHCTRCHMMGWLTQIKQPRSDWETILKRMESFKVNLTDPEKTALLDYLAKSDEP